MNKHNDIIIYFCDKTEKEEDNMNEKNYAITDEEELEMREDEEEVAIKEFKTKIHEVFGEVRRTFLVDIIHSTNYDYKTQQDFVKILRELRDLGKLELEFLTSYEWQLKKLRRVYKELRKN